MSKATATNMIAATILLADEGRLKVLVDQVLPLSKAAEAHRLVEARAGVGKVLLDPTQN